MLLRCATHHFSRHPSNHKVARDWEWPVGSTQCKLNTCTLLGRTSPFSALPEEGLAAARNVATSLSLLAFDCITASVQARKLILHAFSIVLLNPQCLFLRHANNFPLESPDYFLYQFSSSVILPLREGHALIDVSNLRFTFTSLKLHPSSLSEGLPFRKPCVTTFAVSPGHRASPSYPYQDVTRDRKTPSIFPQSGWGNKQKARNKTKANPQATPEGQLELHLLSLFFSS